MDDKWVVINLASLKIIFGSFEEHLDKIEIILVKICIVLASIFCSEQNLLGRSLQPHWIAMFHQMFKLDPKGALSCERCKTFLPQILNLDHPAGSPFVTAIRMSIQRKAIVLRLLLMQATCFLTFKIRFIVIRICFVFDWQAGSFHFEVHVAFFGSECFSGQNWFRKANMIFTQLFPMWWWLTLLLWLRIYIVR